MCVCAKLSRQNVSCLVGHSPPEFGAWKEKGLGSKMIIFAVGQPRLAGELKRCPVPACARQAL